MKRRNYSERKPLIKVLEKFYAYFRKVSRIALNARRRLLLENVGDSRRYK